MPSYVANQKFNALQYIKTTNPNYFTGIGASRQQDYDAAKTAADAETAANTNEANLQNDQQYQNQLKSQAGAGPQGYVRPRRASQLLSGDSTGLLSGGNFASRMLLGN